MFLYGPVPLPAVPFETSSLARSLFGLFAEVRRARAHIPAAAYRALPHYLTRAARERKAGECEERGSGRGSAAQKAATRWHVFVGGANAILRDAGIWSWLGTAGERHRKPGWRTRRRRSTLTHATIPCGSRGTAPLNTDVFVYLCDTLYIYPCYAATSLPTRTPS